MFFRFIMMKNKRLFEISVLISKWLSGEITQEESESLDAWKKESLHNSLLFDRISSTSKISEKSTLYRETDVEQALSLFLKEKKKWEEDRAGEEKRKYSRLLWQKLTGVAALVAIVLGGWIYWGHNENKPAGLVSGVKSESDHNQTVRLISESGNVIGLDTLRRFDGEVALAENEEGMLVYHDKQLDTDKLPYNTIEVPQGGEYKLVLADGTEVYLNTETSFRFPESFGNTGSREVYLTGEAYFRVARDTQRPFIVHLADTYVKVLGTEFNVKAYPKDLIEETTLLRGSVWVGLGVGGQQIELFPGTQASYDKKSRVIEKKEVDVSYYTAWKDGIFAFRENRLEDVMEVLSRWYGFHFFFQDSAAREIVYTGKIVRHGNLKDVLDNFRMTGELDFSVEGNTVIIKIRN